MYRHILIAVDLSESASSRVLEQAVSIAAAAGNPPIDVLHVVEPQFVQYSMDPTLTGSMTHDLERAALDSAAGRLQRLCQPYAIPQSSQHLRVGRPASEVHNAARELNADLVVVGSHGHHGWRMVLGSTANAVLHGTPVDTLVALLPRT